MRNLGALFAAAAALTGCGYVGDPLPPALNIARRIEDLRVVERGGRLIVDFTIPELTTDELPFRKLGEVDLRIGLADAPFSMDGWAGSAQRIEVQASGPGRVGAEAPVSRWTGKEVVAGVRIINTKGRPSDWSNLVVVRVVPPVAPPAGLKAEPDPAGVLLTWTGGASEYRVFRKSGKDAKPVLIETTKAASYADKAAEYGQRYDYSVQALHQGAESEITEAVSITPRDIFPPAVPAGVSGVVGIGSIELVWDRNTESDLKGYRVYRAANGGDFAAIAELVDAPAYSDRQVEAGRKYRYTIAAIDQAGNESARSAIAEVENK